MRKIIKQKINSHILKIIYDTWSSIDHKITILSEFFNRYDWEEISYVRLPVKAPSPSDIKSMIYRSYKLQEGDENTIFEGISSEITELEIIKIVNNNIIL